ALLERHLSQVIPVVHGRDTLMVEIQHCTDMTSHSRACRARYRFWVARPQFIPLLDVPALRQIAIYRIVGGSLVCQDIRTDPTFEQLRQYVGDIAQQAY